jgi:hypothetical protein
MKECKIGAALVPRERGPDLYPVPNVPKIGANISIKNCDYNLAPNELGPIIICPCRGQHNFSQSDKQCRTDVPLLRDRGAPAE